MRMRGSTALPGRQLQQQPTILHRQMFVRHVCLGGMPTHANNPIGAAHDMWFMIYLAVC